MAKLGINTGTLPDDGTGDSLRSGAQKINSNFDELYSFLGDGTNLSANLSGTLTSIANTWSGSSVGIYTSKNVGIGTTNPLITLTVAGSGTSTSQLFVTGISTFAGFTTFKDYVFIEDGINVTGTGVTSSTLRVSGVSTFVGFSTFQDFVFVQDGVSITGTGVTSSTLRVSGVSTFVGFSTFNNNVYTAGVTTVGSDFYVAGQSGFTGFATFRDFVYIQDGLNITGTGITASSLNVTGVTTFVGIVTFQNNVFASSLSLGSGNLGFGAYVSLTSGTSWTVPAGVSLIKVYATGGGAGGAYLAGGSYYIRGGGGGTAIRYYSVVPGQTATYAIGAGGAGASSGGYGSSGGSTTFTYNSVTITGTGGVTGNSNPLQTAQATGGQINLYGGYAFSFSTQAFVGGDAPQATGFGLGGSPTGANGSDGGIIIEY